MGSIFEIGKNLFYLRTQEKLFHRNIYIKKFVGVQGKSVNMIVDPGTHMDMPFIRESLQKLIGGIENLDIIFVNHQDPDVSANIMEILEAAPRAVLLTSEDTWRLIQMYGIPANRFCAIENFKTPFAKIRDTGHQIHFISSPYCHFRGAVMLYDIESRVLMSGDLFGGVNTTIKEDIYADKESWEGISMFHEIYMPSSKSIKRTIDKISFLLPPPVLIAPQHGDLIQEELIPFVFKKLGELKVGVDLLESLELDRQIFVLALQDFLDRLRNSKQELFRSLCQRLKQAGSFTPTLTIRDDCITDIKIIPENFIPIFLSILYELDSQNYSKFKKEFFDILENYDLAVPESIKHSRDYLKLLETENESGKVQTVPDIFE